MKNIQKYVVYVDESGQDTEGEIFVVSVLIAKDVLVDIEKELILIESQSKKRHFKWHKSKYAYRKEYIEMITVSKKLKHTLFVDIFRNSKDYMELTAFATAKSILRKSQGNPYKATVFVDGLKGKERDVFRRGLRDLHIKTRKIRGVKKEENNVFVRLVDSICGLVRDSYDVNNIWAKEKMTEMQKNSIIKIL